MPKKGDDDDRGERTDDTRAKIIGGVGRVEPPLAICQPPWTERKKIWKKNDLCSSLARHATARTRAHAQWPAAALSADQKSKRVRKRN